MFLFFASRNETSSSLGLTNSVARIKKFCLYRQLVTSLECTSSNAEISN